MAYPTVTGVARVSLKWSDGTGTFGSRIYAFYGLDTHDAGALTDLANGVQAAYAANLVHLIDSNYKLVSVIARDLSDTTGTEGSWTGSVAGSLSGETLPSNVSTDVQLKIPSSYRGGHPVMHLPPPDASALETGRAYTDVFVTNATTYTQDFMTAVNDIVLEGGTAVVWTVLRGYRDGALPEAVTKYTVSSTQVRKYVGTMRRRARAPR